MVPASDQQCRQRRASRRKRRSACAGSCFSPDAVFTRQVRLSPAGLQGRGRRVKYGVVSTRRPRLPCSGAVTQPYWRAADCVKISSTWPRCSDDVSQTPRSITSMFSPSSNAASSAVTISPVPLHLTGEAEHGAAGSSALCEHRIRQRQVHLLYPRLPESPQFAAPVVTFMGAAGKRDAEDRIAVFFIQ